MTHPNKNKSHSSNFRLKSCFLIGLLGLIILWLVYPTLNRFRIANQRIQSVNKTKNIVLGLRIYAAENDGEFPSSRKGVAFTSSQDAFNMLIPEIINTEQTFWKKNEEPNHRKPPIEDGVLTKGECIYGYVSGLRDDSFPLSPLVFEGFLNTKDFSSTKYSLRGKDGGVSFGFVDGHVEMADFTSRKLGVENIFLQKQSDGTNITNPENILFPIGWR